jgi:hypothetical protein
VRVFPVSSVASEPAVRAFLTRIVWPEMRHAFASRGRAVGMSDAGVARDGELLDPGSPAWIGADPDTFVVQPAHLVVDRPGGAAVTAQAGPRRADRLRRVPRRARLLTRAG